MWPLADRVLALDRAGRPIDEGPADAVLARSGAAMAAAGIWLPGGSGSRVKAPAATAPAGQVVRAVGLGFGYEPGADVVRDVDLAVAPGERIALVGANGSGKSTLGRLLVGLLRPRAGEVRLLGDDPAGLGPRELARRAGYVFQDPERQFLAQIVRQEVELGLDPGELEGVEPLMASLGLPLETFGERSPYRLSGGEQRRLSLACVLVRRPRLLVLDEPTFGQDRDGYEALLAILRERVEAGTAIIAATHDERLVADFATRVVRLEAGRIVDDTGRMRR
jgi:energy-coupling factor transport system ATP-binding protein